MQRSYAVILLLVICGCEARRSTPTAGGPSIVVLGSSTAAGHGLTDPATSWVQRYAASLATQRPPGRVTNLAVGGFSTAQLQPTGTTNPTDRPAVDPAHNVTAALALHPDAIIVNMPSNDAAMGIPVDESLSNIALIARLAREAHVLFWVTTSQPRQLDADGVHRILEYRDRIQREYGTHAIDFFTPLATPDAMPIATLNQGDGIHPNSEGHRLLFEQVRAANLPAAIAASHRVAP